MAEDQRYCENCGKEIGQATNFCPHCGTAQKAEARSGSDPPPGIPETGSIPIPDAADVPPPPAQSGGRSWGKIVGIGCGALVLLLVLMVGCAVLVAGMNGGGGNTSSSGSGSNDQAKQGSSSGQQSGETTVGVNQPATVADASWTVTSARPATELRSQFGTQSKQGNFVVVDLSFTNNGSEAKTLTQNIINLYDSQNRKSSPDTDTFSYIPNDKDIFLNQVNPGVTKDGEVIFSVAPGSSGYKLELSNSNLLKSDKAYVDLGF